MGNLRPIGSEKLQGMDKINRIMEIARYNENRPKPINEDKSTEYSKTLSDGKTYRIDKEKNGYVLKRTISESTDSFDYLEPMKNRKYYSSYSQALKRLNLVTKEVNSNEGYSRNMSLFTESALANELEEKRYVLNVGKTETKEQAAPAPAPAPVAAPAPAPVAAPVPTEEPTDDLGLDDLDLGDEDEENGEEEKVTLKVIQKATGKLAQKIRAFGGEDDDEPLSSKDMKYVINSILSALDLDSMDEEDKEDIMDKIEGVEEDDFGGSDEEGMGDEDEMGDEEVVEPEAEMAEGADDEWTRDNFDEFNPNNYNPINKGKEKYKDVNQYDSLSLQSFRDKFDNDNDSHYSEYNENEIAEPKVKPKPGIGTPDREKTRQPSVPEWEPNEDPMRGPDKREKVRPAPQALRKRKEFREYDELSSSAPRRHRINHKDLDENDASQLEDMFEGMFTESKVDDVLKKYFKLEEKEKNVLREQKENTLKVRNSSVNVVQEMVSMKVMKKYPKAKFLGRTKNNNLVFEHNNKQFRITPKGGIL
jgi:hypothetical protein